MLCLFSAEITCQDSVVFLPIQFAYLPSQLFQSLWPPDKPVINSLASVLEALFKRFTMFTN